MAFGRKSIPVYLFTGFLDSGKTSFIIETLKEGQFEDGRSTLYITCEEGEEEIPPELLKKNKFIVESIEDEEEVSTELLQALDKKHKPHRIMIEANGMWDNKELIQSFPKNWSLAESIATVDSITFESYLSNMKQMVTNQFDQADLVVFNRCSPEHDRAMFKRMVRAVNKRGQVLFETPEGEVDNDAHEEPPYDINADVIEIKEEDFGIFYLDAMDNVDNFVGKTVCFKGQVFHPKKAKDDIFVPGRFAMTCCADDVAFIGFPCKYDAAALLKNKDWVQVMATVKKAPSREMGGYAPVLVAQTIEPATKAEEDLVYFN